MKVTYSACVQKATFSYAGDTCMLTNSGLIHLSFMHSDVSAGETISLLTKGGEVCTTISDVAM